MLQVQYRQMHSSHCSMTPSFLTCITLAQNSCGFGILSALTSKVKVVHFQKFSS